MLFFGRRSKPWLENEQDKNPLVLGHIAYDRDSKRRIIQSSADQRSELATGFFRVGQRLAKLVDDEPLTVVQFDSLLSHSSSIQNLAVGFAVASTRPVTYIETDGKSSEVTCSGFGLIPNVGVLDILEGRAHYTQLAQVSVGYPRLNFLPRGGSGEFSVQFLTSDKFQGLVADLPEERQPFIHAVIEDFDHLEELQNVFPGTLVLVTVAREVASITAKINKYELEDTYVIAEHRA